MPAALGVITLAWLVMSMARRYSGDRAASIAGLCTAFSFGTFLFTRETLHDIWLVLFITLSLHAFLIWYQDPKHSRTPALLFYAALAGAMMTKSLVGVALPFLIIVLFYLLMRERPGWRDMHLLPGTMLFLALSAPWHLLAAIRNEGFLWSFFMNEQFLRLLGRHDPPIVWSVPLITFWLLSLVWFFPWTAFLPAAISAGRSSTDRQERALARLALAWAAVIMGFFSMSGRLEHYVFPALPALALLVTLVLGRSENGRAIRWAFRGLAILGPVILVAGVGTLLWMKSSNHSF